MIKRSVHDSAVVTVRSPVIVTILKSHYYIENCTLVAHFFYLSTRTPRSLKPREVPIPISELH